MTPVVLIVVAVVVVLAAAWAWHTANRLDRLNVRVDLARQALEAALDRRAVVARTIAGHLDDASDPQVREHARTLAAVADHAERTAPGGREDAENAVSAALARVAAADRPPRLVAELADAETRVMMARRFYNDGVRDTRHLGERRAVRWLRLGGHAALPEYFEITERVTPGGES